MEESNDRKALKSGIWYIVANFAVEGIGFLTMPFFLRLMTKEEVGDYTNFITWVALLLPVLTLSLNTSVTLAKFDFKDKVDDFISSVADGVAVLEEFLCSQSYISFAIDIAKQRFQQVGRVLRIVIIDRIERFAIKAHMGLAVKIRNNQTVRTNLREQLLCLLPDERTDCCTDGFFYRLPQQVQP